MFSHGLSAGDYVSNGQFGGDYVSDGQFGRGHSVVQPLTKH